MKNWLRYCWNNIRRLSGDDAYERYLLQYAEHIQAHNADQNNSEQIGSESPLSKKEFFKQWQDGKWKGIKRCC